MLQIYLALGEHYTFSVLAFFSYPLKYTNILMFIGPCIIVIAEE
jgi:hypothetical protein